MLRDPCARNTFFDCHSLTWDPPKGFVYGYDVSGLSPTLGPRFDPLRYQPKEGLLTQSVEQFLVYVSRSLHPIPRGLEYMQATPILTCYHKRNGVYSTIVIYLGSRLAFVVALINTEEMNLGI